DPLRLASPGRREVAFRRIPLGTVFVPIAHDLVQGATVHTAGQAAHLLGEVMKERRTRRKFQVVDVAVQGLVHSEDELRHATKSPSKVLQDSLSRRYAYDAVSSSGQAEVRCYGQKYGCGSDRHFMWSFFPMVRRAGGPRTPDTRIMMPGLSPVDQQVEPT